MGKEVPQHPHAVHTAGGGKRSGWVEIAAQSKVHPLKVSVSLLSILFKSLSVLRISSILAMECSTVVWCLPLNCRPISGSEASVRCLARNMAIWRGKTMARELSFCL